MTKLWNKITFCLIWFCLMFWIHQLQVNHLEAEGSYFMPKILAWLPPLLGLETSIWAISALLGYGGSLLITSLIEIIINWIRSKTQ